MNAANAVAFFILGSFMEILPAAFPAWFPRTGFDGTSARALWLQLMGCIEAGVAVAFCLSHYAIPTVVRLATVAAGVRAKGRGAFVLNGVRSLDSY